MVEMAKKNEHDSKKNLNNMENFNKYLNKIINDLLVNNADIKTAFENTPFQNGISIKFDVNGFPTIGGLNNGMAVQDQVKKISDDLMFDIFEKNNQIIVDIALQGISSNNIKVDTTSSSIHITASNESRHYDKRIDLPKNVDPNSAKAVFNNNVLEITLTKIDDSNAVNVAVK